jgi:hypothetical protein
MKTLRFIAMIVMFTLALTACQNGISNQPQNGDSNPSAETGDSAPGEGMVFEEDAASDSPQDGFDFSDDEIADDDPGNIPDTDPEGEEDPSFVFDEDEVDAIDEPSALILPPGGKTNWEITYDDGTTTCPLFMETFGENDKEVITIEAGPAPTMDALIIYEFAGTDLLEMWRNYSNPVAEYTKDLKIPGIDMVLNFVLYFDNPQGGSSATTLYGTISSEYEGCSVTRDFSGVLVE